jgi:hypothetical protein
MHSTAMLQQNTANSAQTSANLKAYQGYVPDKNKATETAALTPHPSSSQAKLEPLNTIQQKIQAQTSHTPNQTPKVPENTAFGMQPKLATPDSKGYGAKLTADPMLSVMANRSANDSNAVSFGYISAVNRRENSSNSEKNESKEWHAQREIKEKPVTKSEAPQLQTAQKVAAIEALKEVSQALTKQLKQSHPCISVPIQHPDGIVDINLRFSSNGNVRALFAGSNPEVVQLMAQHRDQFIKTIKGEGYNIDERQMGFIHQTLTTNSIRI